MTSYYQLNKEKINARRRELYKINEESHKKMLERNKRWRDKNKEIIATKSKEYRDIGYYKNKLKSRFELLKNEILINNTSTELFEEFNEILDEMKRLNIIEPELFNSLKNLI